MILNLVLNYYELSKNNSERYEQLLLNFYSFIYFFFLFNFDGLGSFSNLKQYTYHYIYVY